MYASCSCDLVPAQFAIPEDAVSSGFPPCEKLGRAVKRKIGRAAGRLWRARERGWFPLVWQNFTAFTIRRDAVASSPCEEPVTPE